ncbi:TPA: winged helix-turn-helix transcriptional regulator [Candidatus Poribacteria bacterium]|nr:winged helix-turn-helix transcriptional regulator [Candidatus Poribacteria bacterium]
MREEAFLEKEILILKEIEENPVTTQANIASRLGVATGTVNWYLKRLAAKGLIKMKRIGHWQWRYILTPKGMAEKARLVEAYVQRSMKLYREKREEARRLLEELRKAGYGRVRIEGENDLVDICRLTCLEHGVEVVSDGSDRVPVLRVEGMELKLEWPEGK